MTRYVLLAAAGAGVGVALGGVAFYALVMFGGDLDWLEDV